MHQLLSLAVIYLGEGQVVTHPILDTTYPVVKEEPMVYHAKLMNLSSIAFWSMINTIPGGDFEFYSQYVALQPLVTYVPRPFDELDRTERTLANERELLYHDDEIEICPECKRYHTICHPDNLGHPCADCMYGLTTGAGYIDEYNIHRIPTTANPLSENDWIEGL